MIPAETIANDYQLDPAVISSFEPVLTPKVLVVLDDGWYAAPKSGFSAPFDEVGPQDTYFEGSVVSIQANAYERNLAARKSCLAHYGYECRVCKFDFELVYGELGGNYIHVHHIVPLYEIKKGYMVDPINDLVPICPKCHAMIHRTRPALTIEELKKQMKSLTEKTGAALHQ